MACDSCGYSILKLPFLQHNGYRVVPFDCERLVDLDLFDIDGAFRKHMSSFFFFFLLFGAQFL